MAEFTARDQKTLSGIKSSPYKFLAPNQFAMIDEALAAVGEYGVVRLVVEKGRLRFIVTEKSYDVVKGIPARLE